MSFGDTISHWSILYGVYDGGRKHFYINIDLLNKTVFYEVLLSRIFSRLANFSTERSEPCMITLRLSMHKYMIVS